MNPYGWRTFYIVYGTNFHAFAALDTYISVEDEFLVVHHPLIKVLTNHVRVESGSRPLFQLLNTSLAIFQNADDMVQLALGILYFPALTILRVGFHKWQTHVTLGHNHRKECLSLQTNSPQILVQNRHRLPRIVSAGCQRPAEVIENGRCGIEF